MKKKLNLVKVLILSLTLAVMSFSILPAADARPGDITIYCDGSDALCATIETPDVIIDVYFGEWVLVIIEL